MRDTISLRVFGPLLLGLLYIALTGCAVQEPPRTGSYLEDYAITATLCEIAGDEKTLQGWLSTACKYLDTQEEVLGYVVNKNSILIRFDDVDGFAVVCFPCEWE